MEPEMLAIVLRMAERIVAVLAGGMSIVLGYRLFLALPLIESGGGRVTLPGGTAVYLSRVGPGVFFALFGSGLLAWSVYNVISVPLPSGGGAPLSGSEPHGAAVRSAILAFPQTDVILPIDKEKQRAAMVDNVRKLSQLQRGLEGDTIASLSAQDRADLSAALAQARAQLLRDVWDEKTWGALAAFESWVATGEIDPPPTHVAQAARVYRGLR